LQPGVRGEPVLQHAESQEAGVLREGPVHVSERLLLAIERRPLPDQLRRLLIAGTD
jgi:hypothetical protein